MRRRASVPKKYEQIDFTPPKGVSEAAAKGLELRAKASPSNRGGLTPAEASKHGIGSGVQRAVNLKNRDTVSPKVIKQMRGFLSRSEKSSTISPENKGTPWNDKGYVAWLLWGGDPAKAWVAKVIKQMDAADEKEKQKTAFKSDVQETGGIKVLPQGKWVIVGWSELSDYMKDSVWEVYDVSYGAIGKHVPSKEVFGKKYQYLYMIDVDDDVLPDAFIAYKATHAGYKIALGGTDGTRKAKKAMILKMKELIRQPGWYAEASHKVADILESAGARPIDDEEVVRKTLKGKQIEWLGDGKYSRQLGKSNISAAKSLYGTPRVAMQVRVARRVMVADDNEPSNPGLWAKVQALTKGEKSSITVNGKTVNGPNDGKGFTVFPSAYANGWASKTYGDLGGGWKKKASTGDGSKHVGVFAPLPADLAKQFPKKDEDSSKVHVTLCYIGPVPDKQDQRVLVEAVRDLYADVAGPIKARLSGVDYFRSATGSVAYTKVVFSKDMGSLKDRLKSLLEDHGIEITDDHPLAFNPHVTLAYYDDPHAIWDGPVPKGSWTFNEVEVWGLPKIHRLPVGGSGYPARRASLTEAWGPTLREARGKAKKAEAIPGGKARGKKPSDFDAGELGAGIKVEHEHLIGGGYTEAEARAKAQEIAMDHLAEIPDYYTRLDKMESEAGVKHARGKAKKDVGRGGLDEWFSGHGGAKGKGEDATWGDWVSISPVTKTLDSGKKVQKGDIVGECGISDDPDWKEVTKGGEDPLKCMPRQKAYDMPKAERAEKAKAKQKAEKADSSRGKKPTMTPTFQKEKSATVQRIQMKREASARLRAAWGNVQ